ncbi:hypothetical protein [Candidatus Palauibacter sp.]|uniref:hypothetical protein n=1 Tax=Candidatus Palauibacter sp. TaxID=3101350 RepID=UPI003B01A753
MWKRHCFAWEYEGKHADLDAAFNQLRQYALALENPPLLIVSDMCVFRRSRSPIPSEAVHLFRAKPSTDSERRRPVWSGDPEGVLDTGGSGLVVRGVDLLRIPAHADQ